MNSRAKGRTDCGALSNETTKRGPYNYSRTRSRTVYAVKCGNFFSSFAYVPTFWGLPSVLRYYVKNQIWTVGARRPTRTSPPITRGRRRGKTETALLDRVAPGQQLLLETANAIYKKKKNSAQRDATTMLSFTGLSVLDLSRVS